MEDIKKLKKPTESNVTNRIQNPLITTDVINHLNYRIQQEEYSSRLYLSMSMWLENNGYTGTAKLWKKYSEEEMIHADWSREYLLSLGVQPSVLKIETPPQNYTGLCEIVRQSYKHEIEVTQQCKDLCDLALKNGDHLLYQLGLQYVKEQVEEMNKMQTHIDKITSFGEDKIAMRLFDDEYNK